MPFCLHMGVYASCLAPLHQFKELKQHSAELGKQNADLQKLQQDKEQEAQQVCCGIVCCPTDHSHL